MVTLTPINYWDGEWHWLDTKFKNDTPGLWEKHHTDDGLLKESAFPIICENCGHRLGNHQTGPPRICPDDRKPE
jgi:hypothetical protein